MEVLVYLLLLLSGHPLEMEGLQLLQILPPLEYAVIIINVNNKKLTSLI